jgi:uncharacterized protein YecE (DUF72 family)
MEFGRVGSAELETIDLTLPADQEQTSRVLSKSKATKTKVHVGCAKWGRPDWIGKIYPKGTKAADFLDAYARQFNCIEFNAIYYKLPSPEQVATWTSKVGRDFLFCPKFSDVITHLKRLKGAERELDLFLQAIHGLGKHLGPVFLMPHPQMGPKHIETISDFIDAVPKDIDLFLEFRHPEWYTQPYYDTMFQLLEKKKRGAVITDSAGRRDCVHMRLTTPEAFIRFVGNSLHESDYRRIDDWVQRIKQWMEAGLKSCYFFMHQHEELYSPELCKYLIEELNKHCGLDIAVPEFVPQPGTLF